MNGLLDISFLTGLPQQEPSRGLSGEAPAGGELFAALLAGIAASAGLAKPQPAVGGTDAPSPTTSGVVGTGPTRPALADLPWPPVGMVDMPGKAEGAGALQDDASAFEAVGHGPIAAPLAEGGPDVGEGGADAGPGAGNDAPAATAGMPADPRTCAGRDLNQDGGQPVEPSTAARTEPRRTGAVPDPRPMSRPDEAAPLAEAMAVMEPVADRSAAMIEPSSQRHAMPRVSRAPNGTSSDPQSAFPSAQAVSGLEGVSAAEASPERASAIDPADRGEFLLRAPRADEAADLAAEAQTAPVPAASAPADGLAALPPAAGSLGMAPATGPEVGAAPSTEPAAGGMTMPMHVLGQDAAGRSVTARLVSHTDEDGQRLTIELDPADLGPVEVSLHIDEQGRAAAVFSAERMETLQLLQRDASGLAQMLGAAGLSLGQDGLGFMLRDGAADMGRQHRPSGKPTGQAKHRDGIGDRQAASGNSSFVSGRGLLDLRV